MNRTKDLVHDPIFEKPIQEINYLERKGDVKLITKIRSYENRIIK